MKKHYLKIEDNTWRVVVNMITVESWELLSGMKLSQFELSAATSAKSGGVPTKLMMYWLYCSLVAGADLEGREFPYSLEELKKVIKPSILTQFVPIFLDCYMGNSLPSQKDLKKVLGKSDRPKPVFIKLLLSPWTYLAISVVGAAAVIFLLLKQ